MATAGSAIVQIRLGTTLSMSNAGSVDRYHQNPNFPHSVSERLTSEVAPSGSQGRYSENTDDATSVQDQSVREITFN